MKFALKKSKLLLYAVATTLALANCKDSSSKIGPTADPADSGVSSTSPEKSTDEDVAKSLAIAIATEAESKEWVELTTAMKIELEKLPSSSENIEKINELANSFEASYGEFEEYGYFKNPDKNLGSFQNLNGKDNLIKALKKINDSLQPMATFISLLQPERMKAYNSSDTRLFMNSYKRTCDENLSSNWNQWEDGKPLPLPPGSVATEYKKICIPKLAILSRALYIISEKDNDHLLGDRPETSCTAEATDVAKEFIQTELDLCRYARISTQNVEQLKANWDFHFYTLQHIKKMVEGRSLIEEILDSQYGIKPSWMKH